MQTVKITKLTDLDELVAEHLGWRFFKEEFTYCGFPVGSEGWVHPDVQKGEEDLWLQKQEWWKDTDSEMFAPPFASSYAYMETIVNHLLSEEIGIDIWKTDKVSYCGLCPKLYPSRSHGVEQWSAKTGYPDILLDNKEMDSHINSLPLAVCLAFLKYKNVNIDLKIGDE